MKLRIGTRGSALALWQANHVREVLDRRCGVASEIIVIKTSGDRAPSARVDQIGVKGVFTKELEDALLDARADLAVHSMKDVPTEFSRVCRIAPILSREDPRDALVSGRGETLGQLPRGARIGTSSLRRQAQLLRFRPDFRVLEMRGNVETRLRKLDSGECDALVLAKAGMERLGLASRITEILAPEIMLPAVGQGALAVEYFKARRDELSFLDDLADQVTLYCVASERALLADLQGGCRLPLGAWARKENGSFVLDAVVLSADGSESLHRGGSAACGSAAEATALGKRVAADLLAAGAGRLLRLAGRSVGNA